MVTNIIVDQLLDASAITSRELHDFSFEPPFCGITSDGLCADTNGGFVICRNPWRESHVWHLPR